VKEILEAILAGDTAPPANVAAYRKVICDHPQPALEPIARRHRS